MLLALLFPNFTDGSLDLEQVTGFRREKLFYAALCLLFVLLLRQNALCVVHSLIVLLFPATCTLVILSSGEYEKSKFWLRYWVVYALMTTLSRTFKRSNHDTSDLSWMEVIFFILCLIPGTFLLEFVFTFITPIFNAVIRKIEEYNYHLACYLS
ncbi:hypothetical protein Y032_0131g1655 [Ancylostoma ceylanicum]|uniref:Receptor expression-enhancing protein n=1 Tax=Ancylostoma ceylanicum TaxID=53326 RepID=A0A016T750_9BILA|nr:hypothetical protein Y032_0131g1655 [Ancylostoma ceylanicum]